MATDERAVARTTIEPECYPWHDAHWKTLTRDVARLPHALLLYGQAGLGKQALALRLARFLLCGRPTEETAPPNMAVNNSHEPGSLFPHPLPSPGGRGGVGAQPDGRTVHGRKQACGSCQSCALFRAGTHPDLLRVEPQEDGRNILVDQVRGVVEFLSLKPHTAARKVVVLSPAEAMNVNAANSLLKILEEPPAGSVLILVGDHLSRVPVTVRSRCMRVAANIPRVPEALMWLQSRGIESAKASTLLACAGGAPLAALAADADTEIRSRLAADLAALARGKSDPVMCAERWKGVGPDRCLRWLHWFSIDAVRGQIVTGLSSARAAMQIGNESFALSIIDLFDFIDKVSVARRQLGSGVDEVLALEDLLIRWQEMTAEMASRAV